MSKTWYPVIDLSLCTGCRACINKCTHGVYDKEASEPKVIYPDGCVQGCHGCQNLCPSGAIEYVGDTKDQGQCDCGCSCG